MFKSFRKDFEVGSPISLNLQNTIVVNPEAAISRKINTTAVAANSTELYDRARQIFSRASQARKQSLLLFR